MPTAIVGQNGVKLEQSTKIAIAGCGAVKSAKVKKLSRAQKLAAALKVCRSKYKHNKVKRVKCEARARKTYAVKKAKKADRAKKEAQRAAKTAAGR